MTRRPSSPATATRPRPTPGPRARLARPGAELRARDIEEPHGLARAADDQAPRVDPRGPAGGPRDHERAIGRRRFGRRLWLERGRRGDGRAGRGRRRRVAPRRRGGDEGRSERRAGRRDQPERPTTTRRRATDERLVEGAGQGLAVAEAAGRVALEGAQDHRLERGRDRRVDGPRRDDRPVLEPRHQVQEVGALEGEAARERLVEGHAERPDVRRGRRDAAALEQLGRHVVRRPQERAGARQPVGALVPGQAEVRHAHPAGRVHEEVVGLEVAVDDSPGVRVADRARGVAHERGALAVRARADRLRERRPLHQLVDDRQARAVAADGVDLDDPGMLEPGRDLRLAEEALDGGRRALPVVVQQLHGDVPLRGDVERPVDRAEGAPAQGRAEHVPGGEVRPQRVELPAHARQLSRR
ncbi:MAG: hypothetical protein M9894_09205 [Planctomycetes bacterium]|nr:hypothetical protein [Planctomycetota bacterium]